MLVSNEKAMKLKFFKTVVYGKLYEPVVCFHEFSFAKVQKVVKFVVEELMID